jgi:hypothetical protein
MEDNPQPVDPALLIFLRRLVTILTGTMIVGLLVIIVLFVIKFSGDGGPALPDVITLPDGTTATAFTQGPDWYAIVTADNRILIFNRNTGKLRQTVNIEQNSGE